MVLSKLTKKDIEKLRAAGVKAWSIQSLMPYLLKRKNQPYCL